ncbi:MAG TPA: penicillin-binding transpeptidase domain-containing protein [Pyrinomonadaceae bacterium]|nr:penicillin-binding transpeptidase domain-containing protein [Pyrinomonadaceae bacterium]
MTSNPSPKTFKFALILFILVAFIFSVPVLAKRKHSSSSRHASRSERGRKASARDRRSSRRGRFNARSGRRGRVRQMSARDVRRQRQLIAREQSSGLKALERKLRRPLTKRERNAELRRIESRHGRALEAARRRAEAARQAAIARQRALEQAMRDEVKTLIARDDTRGEDQEVRRVAVNALGNHAGTVVVMDPMSGRIYTIVNQEWALRRGFKPCSTIKLVTGLAGLSEKVIDPADTAAVSERYKIDLTEALAYSNNTYFQQVGGRVGFDKMIGYARELGLGEKTGINAPYEYPGRLPAEKTGFALNRMSSHGDDFQVTAVQLATLVSAMANGGKLLAPHTPKTAQEQNKLNPVVRRQLSIEPDNFRRMVPGMVGAVNYGSGKRAYDPMQTVAGKTGTCIGEGSWLGLFTSYAPLVSPRLAVVVIARGSDGRKHLPAAVAGQIYRDLNSRFGTPLNLQFAATPPSATDDSKAAALNEEEKDAQEEEAAEEGGVTADATDADNPSSDATTTAGTRQTKPSGSPQTTPRNTVKRVLMPIEKRPVEAPKDQKPKPEVTTSGQAGVGTPALQRPRRTQPIQP